ncbi:MAG TPA: tetratricopeptide repeat protein [Isosphaeraceae bacterium]
MPRRPAPRRSMRPARASGDRPRGGRLPFLTAGIASIVAIALGLWWLVPPGPETLRARAERAEVAKDWPKALDAWRAVNKTPATRARSWLGEARAALALDLAGQAESALVRATEADPADPEPWRLLLDILRTEGRTTEAQRVGWSAYAAVTPESRRSILRELTLALLLPDDILDDLPDDRSRARLERWAAADPSDANASVPYHRRIAAAPRPGDPGLDAWIAALMSILDRDPAQVPAREALVVALDERGEPDRGRAVLEAWPSSARDARYDRLLGRWALDHDRDPARAVAALERAAAELPQDWKARARLARAYHAANRPTDAAREAARFAMLRELLDPATLVPRLASDLARPDDPRARDDLIDLCTRAGLDRLADAWRREGSAAPVR